MPAQIYLRAPLNPGYSETLIFSTEISRSTSGSEEDRRISRFNTSEPAHKIVMTPYGFSAAETAQVVNRLLSAMRNNDGENSASGVWVPLWGSQTTLTLAADPADTNIFFPTGEGEFIPGGWLVLIHPTDSTVFDLLQIDEVVDSSEMLLVDAVTQTFPVGSQVCPALWCSLQSPASLGFDELSRAMSGSIMFDEIGAPDWEGAYTFGGSTYLSVPIYAPEADTYSALVGGPADSKVLRGDVWNNRPGAEYDPARQDMAWGWNRILRTRAQKMALINWFKYCKGAVRNFWVRFPAPAFYTTATASSGAATITLTNNGAYNALVGVRRHVWCAVTGHDRGYRISNPTLIGGGATLSVTVSPVLAADLPAGSALDLLLYSRYTGDELEFQTSALGPGITEAQETFVEIQRDTPE